MQSRDVAPLSRSVVNFPLSLQHVSGKKRDAHGRGIIFQGSKVHERGTFLVNSGK